MDKITLEFETENPSLQPLVLENHDEETRDLEVIGNNTTLNTLTEDEKKLVNDFIDKIKLEDTLNITSYGKASQNKISNFSLQILNEVKLKDTGEVGNALTKLVAEINTIDEDDSKGIMKFFKKSKNDINAIMQRFSSAELSIEQITNTLENQKVILLKDVQMLDTMYQNNKLYFKELTLYIIAGEEKLKQYREIDIKNKQQLVNETQNDVEVQNLNDMIQSADRFEKRLHDLKLTKTISLQMAPQIRMLQNNNVMLVDKIDSSILNTIPLWRNQMVLSLGISNNQKALELQNSVTNATNEMLKRNSAMLKQGTVELAKENERGIVDVDTLKESNKNLIDTINEVLQIQKDGAINRRNAEKELIEIENELKQALISASNSN